MTKLEAQYHDLQDALVRLKDVAKLSSRIMIHRDATIKRFEFTFEVAWKLMQTIVNLNVKDIFGPKNVIRNAAKLGIIDEPVRWFHFLDDRNLTTHVYKEEYARSVYKSAKAFIPYAEKLLLKVKEYLKD